MQFIGFILGTIWNLGWAYETWIGINHWNTDFRNTSENQLPNLFQFAHSTLPSRALNFGLRSWPASSSWWSGLPVSTWRRSGASCGVQQQETKYIDFCVVTRISQWHYINSTCIAFKNSTISIHQANKPHSSKSTSFATICHCMAIRLTGIWRAGVLCRERQPFPLLQDEWFEDRFTRYPVWDADWEEIQHPPNEPFIYIRVCVSWQCFLKSFELNTYCTNTGVGLFYSGIRYKDGRGAWTSNMV